MISIQKAEKGMKIIEVSGSNLEIIEDLLALIDSVTRTIFKNSDRDRIEFLKDIPYLIFEAEPTITQMELPYPLDDLRNGGNKNERL